MLFFILAGGYGKRAEPLSLIKPKPLFPLNGNPLIGILLKQLNGKGLKKGFINLHYKPDMIRDSITGETKIEYIYEKELSGSKVLTQAAGHIDDFLLVVNGDVFLDIPVVGMQEKIAAGDAAGILLLRPADRPGYPAVITAADCYVRREKNSPDLGLMYTGAALFKREVIERIDEINFFDTLDRANFKIQTMIYQGFWVDIGAPRSYFEADARYRALMKAAGDNSLSRGVTISADSTVHNSIIWENTAITDESRISGCIVTGDMALRRAVYESKIITKDNIYDL